MAAAPRLPPRRALPTPVDPPVSSSDAPPSLPPRPTQRVAPRPPSSQSDGESSDEEYTEPAGADPDEVYDDCNNEEDQSLPAPPEEVYDDITNQDAPGAGRGGAPPLPPHPASLQDEPGELYDDFDEQPAPPSKQILLPRPGHKLPPVPVLPTPAAQPPDETYDDLDNGPVVQQIKKQRGRELPPPPSTLSVTPRPENFGSEVNTINTGWQEPGFSHTGFRPSSPNRSPSPGRKLSAGRPETERALPPIPGQRDTNGAFGQGFPLPPIPSVFSLKTKTPVPASRGANRGKDEAISPVVVPLVRPGKAGLPPLPPPQQMKPLKSTPPRGHAESDEEEEAAADSDEEEGHGDQVDSVYEVTSDDRGGTSALPPPPLPNRPAVPVPGPAESKPAKPAKPATTPKLGGSVGLPAIDANQILGLKNKLRKVSKENEHPTANSQDTKEYGDVSGSVSNVKSIFERKAGGEGRPEIPLKPPATPNKPPIVVGKAVGSSAGSNSSSISNSSNSTSRPTPTPSREKTPPPPSAPDVTFLHKPKHTNVPLPPRPPETVKVPEPEPADPEEIYDDACSEPPLYAYDWFHGDISRDAAKERIQKIGKDGTFLVRTSGKDKLFPYTLVVYHSGNINNLRVRERIDGRFALGDEKPDELAFNDVLTMINHHKKNHVVLLGKHQATVVLQQTPPKR